MKYSINVIYVLCVIYVFMYKLFIIYVNIVFI